MSGTEQKVVNDEEQLQVCKVEKYWKEKEQSAWLRSKQGP